MPDPAAADEAVERLDGAVGHAGLQPFLLRREEVRDHARRQRDLPRCDDDEEFHLHDLDCPTFRAARRESRVLVMALLALTASTGLVDAVSLLGLGRVFTANMTGNVVLLGVAITGTGGFSLAATLTALLAFLAGAAVVARLGRSADERRHGWLLPALGVEVVLVLTAAVLSTGLTPTTDTALRYVVIALLALAMGARNAAVRGARRAGRCTTTVLTSLLTGLAADSRAGRRHRRRLAAAWPRSRRCSWAPSIGGLLVAHVDLSVPAVRGRRGRRGQPRRCSPGSAAPGHRREDDERVRLADRRLEALEHADVLVVEVHVHVAVEVAVGAEELGLGLRMGLGERAQDGRRRRRPRR